jgi:flagellar biosynthetic protein FliQ
MDSIIKLSQEAVWVSIISSLPAIIASLVVGLMVAIFSATTQIQEQTLSFAPKMIAVYLAILAFGGSVSSMIIKFTISCFSQIAKLSP